MLATFFDLGSNFATSTASIAGNLITDLSPILLIVVGFGVGILVIVVLLRVIMHR